MTIDAEVAHISEGGTLKHSEICGLKEANRRKESIQSQAIN